MGQVRVRVRVRARVRVSVSVRVRLTKSKRRPAASSSAIASPASLVMNSTLRPSSRSLARVVHSGSMSIEVSEADLGSASRIAAEVYLV